MKKAPFFSYRSFHIYYRKNNSEKASFSHGTSTTAALTDIHEQFVDKLGTLLKTMYEKPKIHLKTETKCTVQLQNQQFDAVDRLQAPYKLHNKVS